MLAHIKKIDDHYSARFERILNHPVEKVWGMLTDNSKLEKWFSELSIADLRKGGIIKFDMGDGTFLDLTITDFEMYSILEYTWGEDRVRFELQPDPDGTKLLLIEKINSITDHTSKDLAGWHVCLEVIDALLDEKRFGSRKEQWEKWYERYVKIIKSLRS